jgi:excisionase family DNA binding protein
MFNDYKDVVTVEELAEMLKIGRNTAYELVRANTIKSLRVSVQNRREQAERFDGEKDERRSGRNLLSQQ